MLTINVPNCHAGNEQAIGGHYNSYRTVSNDACTHPHINIVISVPRDVSTS